MKKFLIASHALAGFAPEKEAAANPLITNDLAVDTIKFKDFGSSSAIHFDRP